MNTLYCILTGIFGGALGTFPVSLSGHLVFWQKVNTSVSGNDSFVSFGAVSAVYFGIFFGVLLCYHEKVIQLMKTLFSGALVKNRGSAEVKDLEEYLLCLAFYIPSVFYIVLCENANYSGALLSALLCITVVIDFFADFVPQIKANRIVSALATAVLGSLSALAGLCEIACLFFAGRLFGKRPSASLRTAFTLYIPITLAKSIIYFVKAYGAGFGISVVNMILVCVFSAVASCFCINAVRSSAQKKHFKIFAYYTAVFAAILIYTFLKG